MTSAKRAILPFLAISALMLAACASDDSGSAGKAGAAGAAGATGTGGAAAEGGSGGGTNECTEPTVDTGGVVGNCCDNKKYQSTCSENKSKALVCRNGKVEEWTCVDNDCKPSTGNPLYVECKRESKDECKLPDVQTTEKTFTNGASCPTELANVKGICKADKSEGYYCKKDQGGESKIVVVKSCPNKDCTLNPSSEKCGFVECGDPTKCTLPEQQITEEIYQQDADCPEALKAVSGICHKDKKEGFYCNPSTGKVKVKTCDNADCYLDSTPGSSCGFVQCQSEVSGECTGEKVTSGGKEGDCCDKSTYVPGGCIDDKHGLYCKSGKVAVWNCTDPKKCSYDTEKKWYSCN